MGVFVEFGEYDFGEVDIFLEGFCCVYGVLFDYCVDDEQYFVGVDCFVDVCGLFYQFGVDVEVVGGVDDDDVVLLVVCVFDVVVGDFDWVVDVVVWFGGVY